MNGNYENDIRKSMESAAISGTNAHCAEQTTSAERLQIAVESMASVEDHLEALKAQIGLPCDPVPKSDKALSMNLLEVLDSSPNALASLEGRLHMLIEEIQNALRG